MILAGDLFYERETAERAFAFLRHHAAAGTQVLIGDPWRSYLPQHRLCRCREYSLAVASDLEDAGSKRTAVWMLA